MRETRTYGGVGGCRGAILGTRPDQVVFSSSVFIHPFRTNAFLFVILVGERERRGLGPERIIGF